jgi:hypothetical protein
MGLATYALSQNTFLKHQFGKTRRSIKRRIALQICATRSAGMTSKSLPPMILRPAFSRHDIRAEFTVTRVGKWEVSQGSTYVPVSCVALVAAYFGTGGVFLGCRRFCDTGLG